ncbi:MAG: hypothetical protein KatS3mg107_1098 [Gemmataceae bacterium]|nr:MAG: hypothetical protein KatS3mg107_1098 [Gemmataceae bacterium]
MPATEVLVRGVATPPFGIPGVAAYLFPTAVETLSDSGQIPV